MSKKTYMDDNLLIREGFFEKLYKIIRAYPKLKKDKSIQKTLVNLNKDVSELEKMFNQQFKQLNPKHKPIKLTKYKLKDFL